MRVPDEIAGEPAPDHGSGEDLDRIIRRLVDGQLYGVLCTQGQGQPYGSLVAYAAPRRPAASPERPGASPSTTQASVA